MQWEVKVKQSMGRVKIPHLTQKHATDAGTRSMSDTAYMIELRKALMKTGEDNWKKAYHGGKTYDVNALPNNFKVIESGFFLTIQITI